MPVITGTITLNCTSAPGQPEQWECSEVPTDALSVVQTLRTWADLQPALSEMGQNITVTVKKVT